MTIKPWKVLRSSYALDEPWYRVRRDEVELGDGTVIDYYLAEQRDVASVLALTTDDEVLMVRQYKHGAGRIELELPGGLIDEGETPIDAAARELREETGFVSPVALESLGWHLQDASKSTTRVYSFLARDVVERGGRALDPNEAASGVLVERVPADRLAALVDDQELVSSASLVTVMRWLRSR
jgi:8-oxo-dGTP pyrophosphatase MutT (NUDIX family)